MTEEKIFNTTAEADINAIKFNSKEFYSKYIDKITCAFKKDIKVIDGEEKCFAKRTQEREKYIFKGLTDDVILIEVPKDCLAIEFDNGNIKNIKKQETKTPADEEEITKWDTQIVKWVKQIVENLSQLEIQSCVVSHGGISPYVYAFNFENLIEGKEKECKEELVNIVVPKDALKFFDKGNLGNTLIPVINQPHWKFMKYKGEIHKIIRGVNPDKQKNKMPNIVLQRVSNIQQSNSQSELVIEPTYPEHTIFWREFLTKQFPTGKINSTLEREFAIWSVKNTFPISLEEIKESYKKMKWDSNPLLGWIRDVKKGKYPEYNPHTLRKWFNETRDTLVPVPAVADLKKPIGEMTYKQKQYYNQFQEHLEKKNKTLERDTILAEDLFNKELVPIEYYVNKLIPKNSLILVGADSGKFKTGFVLNLALAMTKGGSFLELFPAVENPKILYYEVDGNGKKSIQWKLKYFMNGNNYDSEVLKRITFEYLFYQDFLKCELENITKYDIIILDSFRRFLKGSENDSKVTNDFFLNFLKKAKAAGKTVIVLHHLKKPSEEQSLIHAFRGNTDIVSQFDVVFGIEKSPDKQNIQSKTNTFDVNVTCAKDRDDAVVKNFSFNVFKDEATINTKLKFTGYEKVKSTRPNYIQLILEYLSTGEKSRQEILHHVLNKITCTARTIDNGLKELIDTKEINKDVSGIYKLSNVGENQENSQIPQHQNTNPGAGTGIEIPSNVAREGNFVKVKYLVDTHGGRKKGDIANVSKSYAIGGVKHGWFEFVLKTT